MANILLICIHLNREEDRTLKANGEYTFNLYSFKPEGRIGQPLCTPTIHAEKTSKVIV